MAKFLKITPLDPLFFRTPKPFTAGQQDWAPSGALPLPGTLYGAIRSFILSRRNYEQFVRGGGYPDIGSPDKKGTFQLKAFFLSRGTGNNTPELLFPCPADILVRRSGKMAETKKSHFRSLPNVITSDVKDTKGNVIDVGKFPYIREKDFEPASLWITHEGLSSTLQGHSPDKTTFVSPEYLFVPEPKVGIGRDKITKASETGKLYRVDHFRYADGVSIIAIIDGLEENLNGIFTLGGERRTAKVEEISQNPLEIFEIPKGCNGYFRVYLMTPAIFESGWLPGRVMKELKEKGIELKLISAAINGIKIISGWDIQKKAPKNLYRAVPEGSVYLFEVTKGPIEEALNAFHCRNISDLLPEEGYGFALTGL